LWGCVLIHMGFRYQNCNGVVCWPLLQRISHQITILRTTPYWEKQIHDCKYHLSLCADILWIPKYCYITGVKGYRFYERGSEINWDICRHFFWFWHFMDHQRKKRWQLWENYKCVKSFQFLKCHRNISKQINSLHMNDFITNLLQNLKPLEEFWVYAVSKFLFLQLQKIFKNIMIYCAHTVLPGQVWVCTRGPCG